MSNAQLEMLEKLAAENALHGVFEGISSGAYHAGPGVSSSYLKKARAMSFLHAEHARLNPNPPSDAMEFGTLVHHAIELGGDFESRYIVRPKMDLRTKAGKAQAEEFALEHKGKEICDADGFEAARTIRDKVYAHPELSKQLVGAHFEDSVYWKDPGTGVQCKIRPDVFSKENAIIDWKTTRNASKHGFKTDSFKLGYHFSGAMYVEGMTAVGRKPSDYLLVAIENVAPYEILVFRPEWELFEAGAKDFRKTLIEYAQCLQMGYFPGFGHDPIPLGIPAWAIESQYED